MEITLITQQEYNILEDIFKNYPALTLQNKGYEYLNKNKFTPEEAGAFTTVQNILKDHITGFSKFHNFKVSKDGKILLRFDYYWNKSFTGVGYLELEELLNGFNQPEVN